MCEYATAPTPRRDSTPKRVGKFNCTSFIILLYRGRGRRRRRRCAATTNARARPYCTRSRHVPPRLPMSVPIYDRRRDYNIILL